MGLFPLLPVYASELGASPTVVGIYFALTYVLNSAGTMLSGWAVQQFTHRGAFIIVTALGIPVLFLMGQVNELWQALLLTAILWFSGGMTVVLVNVLAGLHASDSQRGASFSLMFLAFPLGALVGGAAVGWLLPYGYATLFTVFTAIWIALPLLGLLALKDKPLSAMAGEAERNMAQDSALPLDSHLRLLMLVSLLSSVVISVSRLGTTMTMQAHAFSAADIASTSTVSGLLTVPVAFLFGAYSDRMGRKLALTISYALAAAGALLLVTATELWHYWLSATLMMIALVASGAMVTALATDILPPQALDRGLPRVNVMGSIASIISFAATGFLLESIGAAALFALAAAVAVLTIGVVKGVRTTPAPQVACDETAPQPQPQMGMAIC
jgi:AAHS family 4-hydroxybenzoate transporter-like MFS transporter